MKTKTSRILTFVPALVMSLFLLASAQAVRADTVTAPGISHAIDGKQVSYYWGYRHRGYWGPRYYRPYWGGWRPAYGVRCNRVCNFNRWGAPVNCVRRCW